MTREGERFGGERDERGERAVGDERGEARGHVGEVGQQLEHLLLQPERSARLGRQQADEQVEQKGQG